MAAVETNENTALPDFLSGGGEMGARLRAFDWMQTPLGHPASWPHSLKTCVRILLTSRQPMFVWWGKDLINIYNDAYIPIMGEKHPAGLSESGNITWSEIWKNLEPRVNQVLQNNEGTYDEALLLIINRYGYSEETYFKFSYNPVPGDKGGTEGLFCAVTEETNNIIHERQTNTLKELSKNSAGPKELDEVYAETIKALQTNGQDFPFAALYEIDTAKAKAYRKGLTVQNENLSNAFLNVLDWNEKHPISELLKNVIQSNQTELLTQAHTVLGNLPSGAWSVAPEIVVGIPVFQKGQSYPFAVLIVGLNPFRPYEGKYFDFLQSTAESIATSISNARTIEEERHRAQALEQLDNAKTIFFSNISHEFRTPLTLMLSPLEEVINSGQLSPAFTEDLKIAYRNTLRLQKLVNTLLDFSRLEAGRMQENLVAVEIGTLTRDLASTFRSAIEKAGIEYRVQIDETTPVLIDVEMWEKIVLNLISNAFKYTDAGTISISLQQRDQNVSLSVKDTGIGIPQNEIERIFERFHRIENKEGRLKEGTGIGLSLIKELVKLHGGTITVESKEGEGSVFEVTIPVRSIEANTLKKAKIKEGNLISKDVNIFVDEAASWAVNGNGKQGTADELFVDQSLKKQKILLVDDNADMRDYIGRLFSNSYQLNTSTNGEDALISTLQYKPDLILCDIMMSKMNGLQFAKKLRENSLTKNIPLIFLSGRAGEESKLEGMQAGADDYIVKPFSAKELLGKIDTVINLKKSRSQAEQYLYNLIKQAPVAMCVFKGPQFIVEVANDKMLELWGKKGEEVINKPVFEGMPDATGQGFEELLESVYKGSQPFYAYEMAATLLRKSVSELVFLDFTYQPLIDDDGVTIGIVSVANDVTNLVKSRKKVEGSEKELKELANAMPQLVWVAQPDGVVSFYNDRVIEFDGVKRLPDGQWKWDNMVHPDDLEKTAKAWGDAVNSGHNYMVEHRIKMANGQYRWHLSRGIPQKNENGQVIKWFGTATDIDEQKATEEKLEALVVERTAALQRSNEDLEQFAHVASHDLKEPVRKIKTFSGRLLMEFGDGLNDRGKMYLDKIENAANRMYMMIDGILAYSSLNAFDQKTEQLDLNKIIKHIETDLEMVIQQKGAELTYNQLPSLEGYAVLMHQLFYNLINNALKFSRSGVKPTIYISASVINGEAGTQKINNGISYAQIVIEDNGIGFDPKQAERIFKTFTRLNAKDKYEGTGLGLALCKKIVERHGGSIKANGKEGEGSTFMLTLPLVHGVE